MAAEIIKGDILEVDTKCIVHQTNCISSGVSGLAKSIFNKWPESNIYEERTKSNSWHKPGFVYIRKNVINAMGQFHPGPAGTYMINGIKFKETAEMRQIWFLSCLTIISCISNLQSVAFPYKIGCGLAGGNWEWYKNAINDFANNSVIKTFIVKRDCDE